MRCCDCKFHHSGYLWNRCDLVDSEYYNEFYEEPCDIIDDNYIFKGGLEESLGFIEGESALEYMERV